MRVLLLGATGFIGQAILSELLASDCHEVVALVRSKDAAKKVDDAGVAFINGSIDDPNSWVEEIKNFDAIIHVAATFMDDMGDVHRKLINAIINANQGRRNPIRLLYTGGCWLYGDTGGQEYDENGGAISRFIEAAEANAQIEVWGGLNIHWPLVHRKDLAKAYCLALENAESKSSYIVAGESGVPVNSLVKAISRRYSASKPPVIRDIEEIVFEQGDWAYGPALDQKLSSKKIKKELGWSAKYQDALSFLG